MNNDFIFIRKRLLNAAESAEYLGIAKGSFYNLCNQRKIPFITLPEKKRFWRCDVKDLNNFIENNKQYE
mgnify:CR=1 FL=1